MDKRRRRTPFDIFDDFFEDFDEMFEKFEPGTSSEGYSISVTYDEYGRPVVHVKTYGNVDKEALRREIEQRYPGAKIEGLEERNKLIRFVDEGEERPKVVEVEGERKEGKKWKRIKIE